MLFLQLFAQFSPGAGNVGYSAEGGIGNVKVFTLFLVVNTATSVGDFFGSGFSGAGAVNDSGVGRFKIADASLANAFFFA